MVMDTRNARKRRWTVSPEKRTARTSLDFNENTPPFKKRKDLSSESDDDDESKFNVKSFYGGREKKSFPHSPGRRKAASKVLSKLETDLEEEEEMLSLRKLVPGQILKTSNKVKKDVFKMSSTSSDSEPVAVLRESKRSNKKGTPRTTPQSNRGNLSVKSGKKPSPTSSKKSVLKNGKAASVTKLVNSPATPVQQSSTTDVKTPNSGRKFFKSKTPNSAPKTLGSVIISKGFNLKFLPRRRSMVTAPKMKNSPVKNSKKSKTMEVFDDEVHENLNNCESQKDSEETSLESGFFSQQSNLSSQQTNTTGEQKDVTHSSSAFRQCTKSPGKRSAKTDMDSENLVPTSKTEIQNLLTPTKLRKRTNSSGDVPSPSRRERSTPLKQVHLNNTGETRSPSRRQKTPTKRILQSNDSDAHVAKSPAGRQKVSPQKSQRNATNSDIGKSPSRRTKLPELSQSQESDTGSIDGSTDLFTDSCKDKSETSSIVSGPSQKLSTDDALSEISSDISGPSVRPDKKLFSIFNRTPTSSPSQDSIKKCLRRGSPRLRPRQEKDNKEQMVLDVGQKKFGAVQCEVCGMVYRHADPSDEAMHDKFHHDLLNVLKFPGWKKERIVQEFSEDCSRIIMVMYDDPKYAVKKIEDINSIMGQEMGFPEASLAFRAKYKAFLYISEDKKVEGCCIAEPVTQGYRVIPDSQPSQVDDPQPGHRPWYCHPEPTEAAVGISRIWVFGQQRRKGVATKLLDAVRQWFQYGVYIEKNQVAFSDPTSDGKQLACRYTGVPDFLVYKYG